MARNFTAQTAGGKARSAGRKSNANDGPEKPQKPYAEYPLYAHALGYWSAKVNGRTLNFGRWARKQNGKLVPIPYDAGWREALDNYQARINDAKAGHLEGTVIRADTKVSGRFTVKDLCNEFRTSKKLQLDAGDIGQRMYEEYKNICDLLHAQFGNRTVAGLQPKDFEVLRAHMAQRWGPTRLGNAVVYVRSAFKYAFDVRLIDQPVNFGPVFKPPTKAKKRIHKAAQKTKHGKRTIEAEECRSLIKAAPTQIKAMLLLGLNCGFGNHDCATLPEAAIDLDAGWLDYPRPKTGIARRCPLWPETVKALRDVLAARPEPKDDDAKGLVFVNDRGRPWCSPKGKADNVTHAVVRLMKDAGVHRPGLGQYTLRRTFRTVADGSGDQVACNLMMGHVDDSMADTYREEIDDARLVHVAEHVRKWLYPEQKKTSKNGGAK